MPRRPQGPQQRSPQGPIRARLSRWNPRERLTITVSYRGGAEAWYEIHARGRTYRATGVTALHDVMETLYNDGRPT